MAATNSKLPALMRAGEQSAWTTAAISIALTGDASSPAGRAAHDVLAALGVGPADLEGIDRARAPSQATAPLLQAAAFASGGADAWSDQSDAALIAQGRASGQAAAVFVTHIVARLTGLGEALSRPGARMLDVGTGVGALAVAFAEALPHLTVVGLDVLPRVLALAAKTVAASAASARVELRRQDVSTLEEQGVYDLAWFPSPFVPDTVMKPGVLAVSRALRPGGWLMLAHSKPVDDPLDAALARLKTLAFGGSAIDEHGARQLVADVGLTEIAVIPTPPGAPGISVARRPL